MTVLRFKYGGTKRKLVYNIDSQLEAQFWAESTGTSGIYSLVWNSDGVGSSDDS